MRPSENQEHLDAQAKHTGFNNFIDKITEIWFNDDFRKRSGIFRFAYSFVGSVTFAIAFSVYEYPKTSLDRSLDPELLDTQHFYLLLLFVALWFAFLVSYGNTKSGPIRLYLSGFLLPTFIWTIINYVFG